MTEQINYLNLVFRQIDRCNSSKPDELHDATLKLRLLCEPLADEQWKEDVGKIEEELKTEMEWEDLDPDKTEYYKAGIRVLSACLSLLKRKDLIER
jgi:hypothetical protein